MDDLAVNKSKRLISDHYEAAKRIALRMSRGCPAWIAREDLVGAAMIGLVESAERYDDTRQEPFLAFAERRIRGAVIDELRRGDVMPRRVRQLARKVRTVTQRLEQQLGMAPTDEQIARALDVTLDFYREELAGLPFVQQTNLEDAEELASDTALPADLACERQQAIAQVRAALDKMEKRDAQILALHYLEDLTYQQIGVILGITPSRVCQVLNRALVRCRSTLDTQFRVAA